MSIRKQVNMVIFSSLLIGLVACGDHKSSSSGTQREIDSVCSTLNCLASVDWKIFLHGKSFPSPAKVVINGNVVLNECNTKNKYKINRMANPQSLNLPGYIVPVEGKLNIEVSDMGDCSSDVGTSVVHDENVHFEVVKAGAENQVLVNL